MRWFLTLALVSQSILAIPYYNETQRAVIQAYVRSLSRQVVHVPGVQVVNSDGDSDTSSDHEDSFTNRTQQLFYMLTHPHRPHTSGSYR
ncbi:MAG: hypothetical protein V4534_05490 [Myxococcota bacterium]